MAIREILFSDTLSRADRLRYRLPLAVAVATLALGSAVYGASYAPENLRDAYHMLDNNRGCASATIAPDGNLGAAAILARDQFPIGANQEVDAAVTYAAQQAQAEYRAEHAGSLPHAGEMVTTCIVSNPLGGWDATVRLGKAG